jgi:hypothetical protein
MVPPRHANKKPIETTFYRKSRKTTLFRGQLDVLLLLPYNLNSPPLP